MSRLTIFFAVIVFFNIMHTKALAESGQYWTSFTIITIGSSKTVDVLTVPAYNELVLTEVTADISFQYTTFFVNSTVIISGKSSYSWSDGALILQPGDTLSVRQGSSKAFVTISGYWVNHCPRMDFNGDCKVDFNDFAIFAQSWLECNIDPPSACWE